MVRAASEELDVDKRPPDPLLLGRHLLSWACNLDHAWARSRGQFTRWLDGRVRLSRMRFAKDESWSIRLRLLLGDAVDRAHAPNEWFAVDRDHASIGKHALKCFNRARIIRVPKHGSEHDVVGDVEIGVTRRKPIDCACRCWSRRRHPASVT